MKIKIKKFHVAGITGLIFCVSVYQLFGIFLEALSDHGWISIILFLLFILTLVWQVIFWHEYKIKSETAESVAKEIVLEKLKTNPSFFDYTSPDLWQDQIAEHLHKKNDEDSYTINLWSKRK